MAAAGGRKIEYEKVRVCAMLFMVMFHCCGSMGGFIDTAGERWLNDGLTLLFITCNSLFFMLSGKFCACSKVRDCFGLPSVLWKETDKYSGSDSCVYVFEEPLGIRRQVLGNLFLENLCQKCLL